MSNHCYKCGQAKWLSNVFPKVESDLKTAHEVIREFREALDDMYKIASPYLPCEDAWDDDDHVVKMVDRARAVLQKWQGKLGEMK